jgi:hypothetical protein
LQNGANRLPPGLARRQDQFIGKISFSESSTNVSTLLRRFEHRLDVGDVQRDYRWIR